MSMISKDPYVKDIPNTFLPDCVNKTFSVSMLVYGILRGFIKEKDLPEDVRKRVRAELNRRIDHCKKTGAISFPI